MALHIWSRGVSKQRNHTIALFAVAWFLADADHTSAANLTPEPSGGSPVNQTIPLADCWGRIDNPHNSNSDPGPRYFQAKTTMYCDDTVDQLGTLTVTQRLYVRDNSSDSWSWMATNTSVFNAETATNGWVQCRTDNSGFHPVMFVGVNALCEVGSTKDYKQYSSARLVKTNGNIHSGGGYKIAEDIRCKG